MVSNKEYLFITKIQGCFYPVGGEFAVLRVLID
jgi:hypothetical protein